MNQLIKDKEYFDSLFPYIFKIVIFDEYIKVHFMFPILLVIASSDLIEQNFDDVTYSYGSRVKGISAKFKDYNTGMWYYNNWPSNYKFDERTK